MRNLITLLPASAAALLFACAGLAFILQARRLGASLFLGGLVVALLPVVREALSPLIPAWLGILLLVVLFYGIVRFAMTACFGREVANHVLGELLATLILAMIVAPFRFLGAALRVGRRGD